MALVTLNGAAAFGGAIRLPKTGLWNADIRCDSQTVQEGSAEIVIADGALVLKGTARRTGVHQDTSYVQVVAGADGFGKRTKTRHYNAPSIGIVLRHLMADSGDVLSSTASASVLRRQLAAWTTTAAPVGRIVRALMKSGAPDASWRFLPDGEFWVGVETWPETSVPQDELVLIDQDPGTAHAVLGAEGAGLLPGTTYNDRKVSYVEYLLAKDGPRVAVWFEEEIDGR